MLVHSAIVTLPGLGCPLICSVAPSEHQMGLQKMCTGRDCKDHSLFPDEPEWSGAHSCPQFIFSHELGAAGLIPEASVPRG